MVKLIALYRKPEDSETFLDYYMTVHIPLALKMPGVLRIEVSRIASDAAGRDSDYFLEASLYFESRSDLDRALLSAEGQAAARDLESFARYATLLVADVAEY